MNPNRKKTIYCAGQKYESFILINPASTRKTKDGYNYSQWECLCDCGTYFITTTKQIKKGRKSCGCQTIKGRFKKGDGNLVIGKIKFDHYKNSAKRRLINWNLSFEDFISLIFQNCHYCGIEPFATIKRGPHQRAMNGVDRIDSSKGYFKENCVPCCRFCNSAKGDSSKEEFLKWIQRLIKFNTK